MSSRRARRGTQAVEFAVVTSALVLLMLSAIDFGVHLYQRQQLVSAAAVGAREGALVLDGTNLETATNACAAVLSHTSAGGGAVCEAEIVDASGVRLILVRATGPSAPLLGFVAVPATIEHEAAAVFFGE